MDLPDCHADLNELQYAKLMFDSQCDVRFSILLSTNNSLTIPATVLYI